ncbi:MAG: ESX secretion-associated protein EspG [Actinomycetales bacterium]|nr:ESX secretion-associated protein EspG [Actinomycetales bacterium]
MEQSISFADAELALLADLLGESFPRQLGADHHRAATSDARRGAESALRRRGVVVDTDAGRAEVVLTVARLVQILSRPMIRIDIGVGAGTWAAGSHHLAVGPRVGVEAARVEGGYRLTPFATGGLVRRMAERARIGDVIPGPRPVSLPSSCLVAVSRAGDPARARAELADGLRDRDRDLTDALTDAFAGRRTVVSVRSRPVTGRAGGLELAWVGAARGAWEVPPAITEPGPEIDGTTTAELEPIGAERLLTAIRGSIEWLAESAPVGGRRR